MRYRNVKTGAIVNVVSKLKGDWELVEETAPISVIAEASADEKKPIVRRKKK